MYFSGSFSGGVVAIEEMWKQERRYWLSAEIEVVSRGILQQQNLMLITTIYLNRQQNKCTGNHDYNKCLSWPVIWSCIPITNCTECHYYKPNAPKKIPWIGNCSLKVMNATYSVHRQHIMFRNNYIFKLNLQGLIYLIYKNSPTMCKGKINHWFTKVV